MTAMLQFVEGFLLSALVGGVALLIVGRIFVEVIKAYMGLW